MNNLNNANEMETIEPLKHLMPGHNEIHNVSNKMLETLKKIAYKQDDYGFDKYKKPLRSNYKYDWLQMLLEEMADGLKYIQNEMDRKEAVIYLLEYGLESENPKEFISGALEILKISGTGK
jgi:hypothetical protein